MINGIKRNSFIYEYLKYCDNMETAEDFDFWGAIWIISLLTKRNIKINRPSNKLYPNFYITLIADSGVARKSTAINTAKKILYDIIGNDDEINLLTSTTSARKLSYVLTRTSEESNKCIIGINCPEFITFYKNKNVIECFTDFYDCPDERKGYGSITNGEINIHNIFVSSFSASTSNYYFKAITKEEVEGGFTSRNIIIPAEKGKRKIAWGEEYDTTKLIATGKKLAKFISKITEIGLSISAIQRYSGWYVRRKQSTDLYTRTFESREQDFVLKLAAILALNEHKDKIDIDILNLAIKIIQKVKKNAIKFFNDEVYYEQTDNMTRTIERIRDIIHSKGSNGIQHRELYLRVHNSCTSDDYNYIINMMHELGMIEKLQPYKSKAVIYRETKNLYNINTEKILRSL